MQKSTMKLPLIKTLNTMNLKHFILQYGLYASFLIVFLVFTLTSPSFLMPANIVNVVEQAAYYMICAIGATFVIISGSNDLSIGSVLAFSSVVSAMVMLSTGNIVLGCFVAIGVSLACGIINGMSVIKIGMPAFVATIALGNVVRGYAYYLTKAVTIRGLPSKFTRYSWGSFAGIPNLILVALLFFCVAYYVLRHTSYGRKLYAVGGNPVASKIMGINADRIKISAYIISGLCAGIGAILMASRMGSARSATAESLHLECIAAAVIGGTNMKGGEGSLIGTIVGAMLISMIRNGLNLVGLSYFYQLVVTGSIILIASILDSLKHRISN